MQAKLRALPKKTREEKSLKITQKILDHPLYKQAEDILIYVSKDHEVETEELIKKALEEKHIYVPKVEGDQLIICPIKSIAELSKGQFGILEPTEHLHTIHPTQIDLALVPGVAFAENGYRLGKGHGYFDRLLLKVDGKIVGLAYTEQVLPTVPQENHDIPVDLIITDSYILDPKE